MEFSDIFNRMNRSLEEKTNEVYGNLEEGLNKKPIRTILKNFLKPGSDTDYITLNAIVGNKSIEKYSDLRNYLIIKGIILGAEISGAYHLLENLVN